MDKKRKLILYGASFNPPHMGHFLAIQQMLEQYDKVIVFPYPHKTETNKKIEILPIKNRMKMLELFFNEFFPQIKERLLLVDLAKELNQKDKKLDGILHTYDYLQFIKTKLHPADELSVCLGIDSKEAVSKPLFREEEIKKEFGVFALQEEKKFKSEEIRGFLQKKKKFTNADEEYLVYCMGYQMSEYIIKNNIFTNISRSKNIEPPIAQLRRLKP